MNEDNNNNNNNRRRSSRHGGQDRAAVNIPLFQQQNNNNKIAGSDLHEAILANSLPVVQLLLDRGDDPNISPQLAPIGVIAASNQERSRDLHRTLGRVFRSRQDGIIHPLTVAVCNLYHQSSSSSSSFGRENALGIVKALLEAGANPSNSCNGMVFCKIGSYPSITITSAKTASQLALFLKRFSPSNTTTTTTTTATTGVSLNEREETCCNMMDQVTALILSKEEEKREKWLHGSSNNDIDSLPAVGKTWKQLLKADESSFADIIFLCPDGQVKAHKCILAAAIPYFHTALNGPWKENSKSEWTTTNSVFVMKAILEFVYTGRFHQDQWKLFDNDDGNNELAKDKNKKKNDVATSNNITDLLSVASEYQLYSLIERCEVCLIPTVKSPESCKTALLLAHQYDRILKNLKKACLEYVVENSTLLLTNPSFLELSLQEGHSELWEELKSELLSPKTKRNKRRRILSPAESAAAAVR